MRPASIAAHKLLGTQAHPVPLPTRLSGMAAPNPRSTNRHTDTHERKTDVRSTPGWQHPQPCSKPNLFSTPKQVPSQAPPLMGAQQPHAMG